MRFSRAKTMAPVFLAGLLTWLPGDGRAAQMPAPAHPVKLLVFGDSIAAGYGLPHEQGFETRLAAALQAAGRRVTIQDGAVSGDTTAGGAARIDWALGDAPDAAIVELGGNDALRGLDPAEVEKNLAAILDALAGRHVRILLEGMEAPRNLGADYDAKFHAVFEKLGRRPGLLFDPFLLQGVATVAALNQADGIHPNAEGVKPVVAHVLPLAEALVDSVTK